MCFMQDGARSHTANETVRFFESTNDTPTLLQQTCGLQTVPDLDPVRLLRLERFWSEMFYRGRFEKHHRIERSNSSKVRSITPSGNQ